MRTICPLPGVAVNWPGVAGATVGPEPDELPEPLLELPPDPPVEEPLPELEELLPELEEVLPELDELVPLEPLPDELDDPPELDVLPEPELLLVPDPPLDDEPLPLEELPDPPPWPLPPEPAPPHAPIIAMPSTTPAIRAHRAISLPIDTCSPRRIELTGLDRCNDHHSPKKYREQCGASEDPYLSPVEDRLEDQRREKPDRLIHCWAGSSK